MTPEEIASLQAFSSSMNGPQFQNQLKTQWQQQLMPVTMDVNSFMSQNGYAPTPTALPAQPNGGPGGTQVRSPVTPIAPAAQPTTLPGSGAPSSLTSTGKLSAPAVNGLTAQPAYLTKPMSEWTGADFAAYKDANAPNNAAGYANMAMQGVNSAAQIGMGIASLVQAQDAFNLQKKVTETNLARQLTTFNHAVEDRGHGSVSPGFYAANKDAVENDIKKKQMT